MREVDPSEYQPQVVVLDERLSEGGSEEEESGSQQDPGKDHSSSQSSPAPEVGYITSHPLVPTSTLPPSLQAPSATVDKTQRWLLKLQRMRQKVATPPTD